MKVMRKLRRMAPRSWEYLYIERARTSRIWTLAFQWNGQAYFLRFNRWTVLVRFEELCKRLDTAHYGTSLIEGLSSLAYLFVAEKLCERSFARQILGPAETPAEKQRLAECRAQRDAARAEHERAMRLIRHKQDKILRDPRYTEPTIL